MACFNIISLLADGFEINQRRPKLTLPTSRYNRNRPPRPTGHYRQLAFHTSNAADDEIGGVIRRSSVCRPRIMQMTDRQTNQDKCDSESAAQLFYRSGGGGGPVVGVPVRRSVSGECCDDKSGLFVAIHKASRRRLTAAHLAPSSSSTTSTTVVFLLELLLPPPNQTVHSIRIHSLWRSRNISRRRQLWLLSRPRREWTLGDGRPVQACCGGRGAGTAESPLARGGLALRHSEEVS